MKTITLFLALTLFNLNVSLNNLASLEQDFINEMDIPAAQSNTNMNNGKMIERIMAFGTSKLPGSKQNTRVLYIEDRYYTSFTPQGQPLTFKSDKWEIDFGQMLTITVQNGKLKIVSQTVSSKYTNKDNGATTFSKTVEIPDISNDNRYANKSLSISMKAAAIFQELRKVMK